MHFTNIIVSVYVVSVCGAPITSDLLRPRDDDGRRHCVGTAPMVQVAPGAAPVVEIAPAVYDKDLIDDLENLETWPRVKLEDRNLNELEEDVGEMEDAEELEDRDVGAVETTNKHKHIRCAAPAVWNVSLRRCVANAAPAPVATCVSPMVYNVMTGQCVHPAATTPVPQCIPPMVYEAARRMCVRPAAAQPALQCAAPLVYNPATRQCTMPTAAPAPAPAPSPILQCVLPLVYNPTTRTCVMPASTAPSPVVQCAAPTVYNPTTRTCVMPAASPATAPAPAPVTSCVAPMVYNPATRTCVALATGTATVLAKPTCALGEMAYCAKTSTNYVAYDAANPLCRANGVNMVFCAAPARVMAMLHAKTFADANATASDSGL
ncbi:hypothetical protein CMUS01_13575 [Colletotrichum musicola]|uniref:Uncharacterized protein n=1 Tax=Colletotrichum musicola TaxID=2175873 RepID=A0A8H6JB87_9PEZI|nr:hypothetical protein CMUS01_13575 [Colletotrichum musicola]